MSDSRIEDRLLIREVYGRYAMAVVRQDGADWLDCWSADATWKTPQFEVAGHAALEQMWTATWTDFRSVTPFNEIGPIAFTQDGASVLSTVLETIALKSGSGMTMTGLYTDRLVREGGEWRFAYRAYTPIGQPASLAGRAA
ncbi:SnoaL-like protein [Novosphingobium sp. PhB55]|uniref:nuclear transport factor 2 family protein n=1 Tax=Novosphingobium sp. PhB55 TaxID=2485106 RepID=UPI0010E2242E|nr:nuclear transport factor 2 family protein [Novosphingobium sp. PhB55]TDW60300.1 SnoaL-like protein [Novosphingobium sp. PhB55]